MPAKLRRTLLVILMVISSTIGHAQSTSIHVEPGNYSLNQILKILKKEGIQLAYSSDRLPDLTFTLSEEYKDINKLFEQLSKESDLQITFRGSQYLITYPTGQNLSIRGAISDATSGEVLIGAAVYAINLESGVTSNNYGYYSLQLPEGKHVLRTNYIGYETRIDTIVISDRNQVRNLALSPKTEVLNEVVVSAYEPDLNIESTIPGVNTINLNTRGQIPYFLGEVDVLQGATLLPGINTLGEDANGLSVRGGSVDQNLILLDESTIYNPNHLYGLISIFNPEAVNKIEIMKGFIPPSYGGRTSSVMTIHQKEGDYDSYHITGGIGIVSARLIAEGPIKKDVSSFIVSARQSLFDLTLDANSTNYFQDFNAKTNWKINPKNTFYLSGYIGNDRSSNVFDTDRIWGNRNLSMRWNHLFGQRVFANFSAIYSQYDYKITQPREAASFIGQSNIIDYTLKSDWGFVLNNHNEFNFGGSTSLHRLIPGSRVPYDENSSADTVILNKEYGLEQALYLSHKANYNKVKLEYGLRVSSLFNVGPADVYIYDEGNPRTDENIIDTVSYAPYKLAHSYYGFEPRASFVYQWAKNLSTKMSFTRTYQYLHLISNTVTPTPTDIWKLSDQNILPTESNHYSLGLFYNFDDNNYETFVDGYYKTMTNLVEYKNGADLLFNENPETELVSGEGRNYGVEFFLKKNKGKLTGWTSYTLSRSELRVDDPFESINNGQYFPSNFDRKHDISVVGVYELTKRLYTSISFNYNSGRPYTRPIGKYTYEDIQVPRFEERNQGRLPAYHRMDLSIKWHTKNIKPDGTPKRFNDYWTVNIYNVYGKKNVYSYVFEENEAGETEVTPYTVIDTIVPSLSYHFKF